MKKSFHTFIGVSVTSILFVAQFNLLAQNRGASSCPDFSSDIFHNKSSFKKKFDRFRKFVIKSDNIFKINLLARTGATSTVEHVEISNGDTIVNDTTSKINASDMNKYGFGFRINYERKIHKTSSVQLSLGYYLNGYAESWTTTGEEKYSTESKGSSKIEEVSSGISSAAWMFMGQYRFYFKPRPKGLYFAPYLICKKGKSLYVDTIQTKDKNDFDFTEKSLMYGGGLFFGYQFLIGQKFVVDFFIGPEFRYTQIYDRKFLSQEITQEDFLKKHDNDLLMKVYDKNGFGVRGNLGLGYKFGKDN